MGQPFFNVPLNLPHAARLTHRLAYHVERRCDQDGVPELPRRMLLEHVDFLVKLLSPYLEADDNPEAEESARVVAEAAERARQLVAAVEMGRLGDDRLGQVVRNFFECLELGEEGARISLRAGEHPESMLRPI